MGIKGTRKSAASKAGKALRNPKTSTRGRKVAASALSQRKSPKRATTRRVASVAGAMLQDGAASKPAMSAAASVLSQARFRRKKKATAKTSAAAVNRARTTVKTKARKAKKK